MFRRVIAPLATVALLAVAARVLMWAAGPPIDAVRSGTATFDEMLGAAAAIGAWALLGWVVLVLAGTALAALPGAAGRACGRVVRAVTPVAARRTARLALGVAVATGPVAAAAVPAAAHQPGDAVTAALLADAEDLPLIERPTRPDQTPGPAAPLTVVPQDGQTHGPAGAKISMGGDAETPDPTPTPAPAPAAPAAPAAPGQTAVDPAGPVTVQAGDTLWTIAARQLGPEASDADVAATWPRWYEANRDVVGDDPDMIIPGTVLTPPETA